MNWTGIMPVLFYNNQRGSMRTPLKWVGSKARIMDRLAPHLTPATRLVEPFGGSAAVMVNTDYPSYLIGDVNQDLINFHLNCRDNTQELIDEARKLFATENSEASYMRLRRWFNEFRTPTVYRSALFLFLNRHCFNGLCRYNASGEFNVPYGKYHSPYFPQEEIESFANQALRAEFKHQGWLATLMEVRHGDIVYIDPPYIPLTATSSFTNYAPGGFGLPEQKELAEALLDLGSYGIPIIASNSNAVLSHELYKQFTIHQIHAPRSIGGASSAKELIATLNC
uniref:site-specific DNA-methyltransferase (adenine-specific) n=1 Tax=Erwinia phage Fifi051 TaxID=3238787 RepID=A0AB39ACN7_9CAUD